MKHHSFRISGPGGTTRDGMRRGDGRPPAYELRWNIWDLELVQSLPKKFVDSLAQHKDDRELQSWPSSGVFLPRGYVEKQQLQPPVRQYDPVPQADEILTHVTRLKMEDPLAILEFLNRWGPLGLGEDEDVYARLG